MPVPTPEPGLVISYSYLWNHEARDEIEEGRKDRPCVIVLAVERVADGGTDVVVVPITHRAPREAGAGIEIPPAVKRHLGLDDQRSWVVVTEGDRFIWPGYDLRAIPGGNGYDYGFLPPGLFRSILEALRAWHQVHKVTVTPRS